MKLSRKMILSVVFIVVLATSGIVVWTQFFNKKEVVILETTMGNIEIELDRVARPNHGRELPLLC